MSDKPEKKPQVHIMEVGGDMPPEAKRAIEELLHRIGDQPSEEAFSAGRQMGQAEALLALRESYSTERDFGVGDIVVFKKHMRIYILPKDNQPAIALAYVPGQTFPEDYEPDSPYWMTPRDLQIGVIDPNSGAMLTFWVDSKRMQKWTPPTPVSVGH